MQKTELSSTLTNPSLLLVEPDTLGFSDRATQLGGEPFCVTRADTAQEIYLLRRVCNFSIAVLSDRIGFLALRASAQLVRGQWPKARILILGKAPSHFDDNLYEEAVLHTSSGAELVATIQKVSLDLWNQRVGSLSAWIERVRVSPLLQQRGAVLESDPTKVPIPPRTVEFTRDWPATEQLRHAVR